jgi:Spy/CpxP family protein refolding chaperone
MKIKRKTKMSGKEIAMKKVLKALPLAAAVLLFAAHGSAQPFQRMGPGMDHMQGGPGRILFVLRVHQGELKITDDQLKKIEGLVFSFEEKMIAMDSASRISHMEIEKLMLDRENLDYGKLRAALDKTADQRNEIFIARLKNHEEVMNVLTPEQREAVKSMIRKRIGERWDFPKERGFRGERGFRRFPRFSDPDHPFPEPDVEK